MDNHQKLPDSIVFTADKDVSHGDLITDPHEISIHGSSNH